MPIFKSVFKLYNTYSAFGLKISPTMLHSIKCLAKTIIKSTLKYLLHCTNFLSTEVSERFVYRFALTNYDGKNFYAKLILSLDDIASVAF